MALYQLQIANQLFSLLSTTYSLLPWSFTSSQASSQSASSSISASKGMITNVVIDPGEMSHLLRWMELFFNADHSNHSYDSHDPYMQELYNLFVTIRSDYAGYIKLLQYNQSLWLFASYRQRDLSQLAQKIRTDIKMFERALELFAFMKNIAPNKNECSDTLPK